VIFLQIFFFRATVALKRGRDLATNPNAVGDHRWVTVDETAIVPDKKYRNILRTYLFE
jgi:hypothetical protein